MIRMQVKKEEVKNNILDKAKQEFLEKGFQKSSLRSIAARAGVTKGNIYNYFGSKDELFEALVVDTIDKILDYDDSDYGYIFDDDIELENKSIQEFYDYVRFIESNRDEMMLLFFSADGSKYSNFRQELINSYKKSSKAFYEEMKTKTNKEYIASDLFISSCSALYISFIETILLHKPEDEKLDSYIREMATFVNSGTKAIVRRS